MVTIVTLDGLCRENIIYNATTDGHVEYEILPLSNSATFGLSASILQTLKDAKGKYVCFLSSKNFYSEESLQRRCEYLDLNELLDAVGGGVSLINDDLEIIKEFGFVYSFPEEIKYYAKYGVNFDFESMMFRKASLEHFLSERQNVVLDNSFENLFRNYLLQHQTSNIQGRMLYRNYNSIIKSTELTEDNLKRNIEKATDVYECVALRNIFLKTFHLGEKNGKSIAECYSGRNFVLKKADPLVSIIIPTHNRADRLPVSVGSVIKQIYHNIEIIIIDDCSSDNTEEVVKALQQESDIKIKYYRFSMNRGAASARNYGVKLASGEYVAFHDDDDEWHLDKLLLQMALLKSDSCLDMVFSSMSRYKENEHYDVVLDDFDWYNIKSRFFDAELLNNYVGAPTIVIKKKCFESIGGFCEELRALEDWEFAIRAAKNLKTGFISSPLIDVNMTENSVTHNTDNVVYAYAYIMNHYLEVTEKKGLFIRTLRTNLVYYLSEKDNISDDLNKLCDYLNIYQFSTDVVKELLQNTVDHALIRNNRALQTRFDTLFEELEREIAHTERVQAELERQYSRNEALQTELERQYDNNKKLQVELEQQYINNAELKRQYEINARLQKGFAKK